MSIYSFLVFASCIILAFTAPQERETRRRITSTLKLDNGLDWGEMIDRDLCPDGSFAQDIEVKFEDYGFLDADETALNSIKLYCSTLDGHHTGYITSTEGTKGDWKGMNTCPNGLMTGMRARVLGAQGIIGDDVAVQNIEIECNYGEDTILGMKEDSNIRDGEWSSWSKCNEGSAICGLEVGYEKVDLIIDDSGVTDILMECCSLNGTLF